jgi:hypothetical protein
MVFLIGGIYFQLYAPELQERVGPGISEAAVRGTIGGIIVFFMIFLTTNEAMKRKNDVSRTMRVVFGLLNTAELFGSSAVMLYLMPPFPNVVTLGILFLISGVVGGATCIALYDWKLSPVLNKELKLKDLEFIHDDSLQSLNLMAWASIVFLTSGVVAALIAYQQSYPPGTAQANIAYDILVLDLFQAIFVGIGFWMGWITPALHRLEDIRLELRLERSAGGSQAAGTSQTQEQASSAQNTAQCAHAHPKLPDSRLDSSLRAGGVISPTLERSL